MSPTVIRDLDRDLEPLPVPPGASGKLSEAITDADAVIWEEIRLLAAKNTVDRPAWDFDYHKIEETDNKGAGAEAAAELADTFEKRKQALEEHNRTIDDTSVAAFDTSNSAYKEVKGIFDDLRTELAKDRRVPVRVEVYPGEFATQLILPASKDTMLVNLVGDAVDRITAKVEDTDRWMQDVAASVNANTRAITPPGGNSSRVVPASWSGGGSRGWSGGGGGANFVSAAHVAPGTGTRDDVLRIAQGELKAGVSEDGGNNVPRYRNGAVAPYNINNEWCAAFATWVWEEAGYDIDWTNPNLVQGLWGDAQSHGLAGNVSAAAPGDMIVFGWGNGGRAEDHVGIITQVDRDGTIHTIEGNTGNNRLEAKTWSADNGAILGVIKPPENKRAPIVA